MSLSVNASPAMVLDRGLVELMDGVRWQRATGWSSEITEHAAVSGYEDIRAALLPHRERGLKLAVDDTGAGYASFAHVLRLRPDIIKLDRSLLADIDHDAARRAFVTAIVLMALELDAPGDRGGRGDGGRAGHPAQPRGRHRPGLPAGPAEHRSRGLGELGQARLAHPHGGDRPSRCRPRSATI